jgi:hypothetical protein
MLAKAGEHGLLRSPACKPILITYLPPPTFAAIRSASLLKPVIARVGLQRRWVARRGCPRPAPFYEQ